MGGACGTCGKEENRIQVMVKKYQRHISFERQRVKGRATVTWILNFKNVGNFDWINLAEDRNKC
jgi:translation initiation factor 1 (eIF-1/SUI1)